MNIVDKYLMADGTVAFLEVDGATSYFSDSGQLFIGNASHPVATRVNQTTVMMTGNSAVEGSLTGPLVETEGWVTTGWASNTYRLGLGWTVDGGRDGECVVCSSIGGWNCLGSFPRGGS
jgi:hypothetical protein